MAGLESVFQLMNNLPALLSLIERAFFLAISFALAGFAWYGWKRYKNWGITITATILLALIVQAGAILLGQLIPFRVPYIPYALHALIIAVILFIILRLLSGDAQQVSKLVKGETFKQLRKEFEELKKEFHRLVKLLEHKKITPEPLSAKKLEKELNKLLADKGIKEFTIKKREVKQDQKTYQLKSKEDKYQVILDVYTGELISFGKTSLNLLQKTGRALRKLAKNEKVMTGLVISIILTILLLIPLNQQSINEIQSSLDLSLTTTPANGGPEVIEHEIESPNCLSARDLLYVIATEQFIDYNETVSLTAAITNEINNSITEASIINYEEVNYYFITTTSLNPQQLQLAIQNHVQQNLMSAAQGNINFCDIRYNYQSISNYVNVCSARANELCECKSLSDLEEYCFIFSERLSQQLSEQLGEMGEQVGGLTDQLGSLSDLLGGLQ